MATTLFPDRLRDVRFRKTAWQEVALQTREVLERAGSDVSIRSETINLLADWTGYSSAILIRQQALLTFIEHKAELRGSDAKLMLEKGFTSLELVASIDRHDPELGEASLDEVLNDKIGVAGLRSRLADLVRQKRTSGADDRDVLSAERHERHRRVRETLEKEFPGLESLQPFWRYGALGGPPVCRFSWCRRFEGREQPGGFDAFDVLYVPTGMSAKRLDDRIARSLTSAHFFRRFWITLAEPTPMLSRIEAAAAWLGQTNIGILQLLNDGRLDRSRDAKPATHGRLTKAFESAVEGSRVAGDPTSRRSAPE
jgi:hypothetical protein